MERKIGLAAVALIFLGAVLWVTIGLLSEGFSFISNVKLLLVLVPLAAAVLINYTRYWFSILIGSLCILNTINYLILDRLSMAMIAMAVIGMLLLVDLVLKREPLNFFKGGWDTGLFLVYGGWVIIRFLYDRPGSARMGGEGGLGEALPFLFSVIGYGISSRLVRRDGFSVDMELKLLKRWAFAGLILYLPKLISIYLEIGQFDLFSRFPMWILSAYALTWAFDKRLSGKRSFFKNEYIIIMLVLLAGVASKNRLSLVMAGAIVMGTAFLYRRFKKAFVFLLMLGVIAVPLLILNFDLIPFHIARTLTLLIPRDLAQDLNAQYRLGEVGWESQWRTDLAKLAWMRIQASPIWGNGLTFTFHDILQAVSMAHMRAGQQGAYQVFALSGAYHNGILTMAVFLGIPATLCFIAAALSIYIKFSLRVLRCTDPAVKRFGAILAGAFLCYTGKMLTNGSAPDIFALCLMLGVMSACLLKRDAFWNPPVLIKEPLPASVL
jgi:hypothetical protein